MVVPPHDGEALVTVEGDRVLFARRVPVRASGTAIEIPVDPSWNRHDLYVGVVAFRPGSEGDRVTPARTLGLVHLPLARDARRMKLEVTAPAKVTPEQSVPVRLRLTDAAGRAPAAGTAIVTVSAVDVGILGITRYASPDPADFFFGKHRYEADLLDLYGKLIEKMEGAVARQRFGGDAGVRDTQSLPRRVRLVDLFSGPVAVDARGEATVPLALPDFNGTLRLMAVAATTDAYASAQAEMTVAAPLAAELSMPRFVSPGRGRHADPDRQPGRAAQLGCGDAAPRHHGDQHLGRAAVSRDGGSRPSGQGAGLGRRCDRRRARLVRGRRQRAAGGPAPAHGRAAGGAGAGEVEAAHPRRATGSRPASRWRTAT